MNNSLRVNSKNADNSSTSEAVFPKMCVPEKSALYVAQERSSQNGFFIQKPLGLPFQGKQPVLILWPQKLFLHLQTAVYGILPFHCPIVFSVQFVYAFPACG